MCLKRRELFNWHNVGYLIDGDHYRSMVSLPMLASFTDSSMAELPIWQIDINWKSTTSAATIADFKQSMMKVIVDAPVSFSTIGSGDTKTTDKITNILNKVFNVIIVMTMFLCFFALSANMSANLYEQTKEIGVLRSIGFTKTRIRMLYFYEAMVLVLASCLMGVMVGMTIA
jgi:ABC-type antimicrobial peptide transport system permease subunit